MSRIDDAATDIADAIDWAHRADHGGEPQPEAIRKGIAGALFLLTTLLKSLERIANAVDANADIGQNKVGETTRKGKAP